jgi:release factor glutamine methyltransferase
MRQGAAFLSRHGVESPRLQVELFMARALRLPRLQLSLHFERVLVETESDAFQAMVRRRARREPLQHILGTVSFCGLELEVGPGALIPRPETEILAEKAWTHLRALPISANRPSVLDFGTGTGCLAIAIAVNAPAIDMHALDLSTDALGMARRNALRHLTEDRIRFHLGDGFPALPLDLRFDLIVSNPPYIPSGEIEGLEPEVRDHDPRLALDGGPDGLDFYRRLAVEAPRWLKPDGHLLLEFGDGQAPVLKTWFDTRPWRLREIIDDYSRRPRHLHAVACALHGFCRAHALILLLILIMLLILIE